ncbi:MAG: hypothetical protein ACTHLY_20695 [Pseudolabrys sp.]
MTQTGSPQGDDPVAAQDKTPDAKLPPAQPAAPKPLKEAIRDARIEAAERSGVVVDLRDADVARLELLDEALNPLFADVPSGVEIFDRGISRGDVPKLWVDVIAHVEMGRDKRIYRFVQDTRFGRKVLAESYEVRDLVEAVTRYVARRLVERERALAEDSAAQPLAAESVKPARRRGGAWFAFLLGLLCGVAALFGLAWLNMPH